MKLKIVSDGTSFGSKLIDEESGKMINLVQKLTWKATADDFLTYSTVEMINVPVDIVVKAEIHEDSNVFEKDVRIITESIERKRGLLTFGTEELFVYDAETNLPMPGISEIYLEITTEYVKAKIKKVKSVNEIESEVEGASDKVEPIDVREFGNVFTDIYAAGKGTAP